MVHGLVQSQTGCIQGAHRKEASQKIRGRDGNEFEGHACESRTDDIGEAEEGLRAAHEPSLFGIGNSQGHKRGERWNAHTGAKRNNRDGGEKHPPGGSQRHARQPERHARETQESQEAFSKARLQFAE